MDGWDWVVWAGYLVVWLWLEGSDIHWDMMLALAVLGIGLALGWLPIYMLAVTYDRISLVRCMSQYPNKFERKFPKFAWLLMGFLWGVQLTVYVVIWWL